VLKATTIIETILIIFFINEFLMGISYVE